MSDQPVIVADLEVDARNYIHNDLISAAFNLKERIEANIKNGELNGIGLDIMAAVTMTAFAYEAYLNFVGWKVIPDFVERQSGIKKRDQIMGKLGIEWDDEARPFATISRLIKVRDSMAHGKPSRSKTAWEAVGTHSQLVEKIRSYKTGIEAEIDYDFLRDAYDDVEIVWRDMLKAGNIEVYETLDGVTSGITFKAYAEPATGWTPSVELQPRLDDRGAEPIGDRGQDVSPPRADNR